MNDQNKMKKEKTGSRNPVNSPKTSTICVSAYLNVSNILWDKAGVAERKTRFSYQRKTAFFLQSGKRGSLISYCLPRHTGSNSLEENPVPGVFTTSIP